MSRDTIYKAEEVAPEFEPIAVDLWLHKRFKKIRIWLEFCRRYGDTAIARSSFYRWFDKVLTVNRRDEEIRTKARAILEEVTGGQVNLKDAAQGLALQAVLRVLYENPDGLDPKILARMLMAIDRIRRTELDFEKYQSEVKRRMQEAVKETERTLAAAGVKRATVNDVVKQVYGIA